MCDGRIPDETKAAAAAALHVGAVRDPGPQPYGESIQKDVDQI
jgi:hypothetical protein